MKGKSIADWDARTSGEATRAINSGAKLVGQAVTESDPVKIVGAAAETATALWKALRKLMPVPVPELVRALQLEMEMGELTIPELLVARKVFKNTPAVVATINKVIRVARKGTK